MRKIVYILASLLLMSITSCGDDKEAVENVQFEAKNNASKLKGFESLNLSEWGYNLSVKVPSADMSGAAEVVLTERGTIEIKVGSSFGIEIMYGEGDLELLKMDLKEDLVFSHEIIKEEENALIYSQDIPEAGVKTQNHFFYKATVGNDIFEVRELLDGNYSKGMIEKMLAAAKTLKAVAIKPNV